MNTINSNVSVVTGVTSGLGKAIALALAKTGGTVILVARDPERGAQVEKEIATESLNPNVELQLCDISNLSSVRNLAVILNNKFEKIDVLVNNAGLYKNKRTLTVDGFEEMFAANHLGPFLLTNLLLDRLRASPSAHIINVTAPATTPLYFDDLQSESHFNPLNTFGSTKMANLLFTRELARRLQDTNIRVNAFHPGLVRSSLMKESPLFVRLLTWLFASSPDRAAGEIAQWVNDPEYQAVHGKFIHRGKEIDFPAYALDETHQKRLWEISEALTDASEPAQNYDPTGSVALHNNKELPEDLIRPEEDPTGVASRDVKDG
jgi:NAD(P)-dependent dehydrogenase (short-subunit alcohol dehydrogenase family)